MPSVHIRRISIFLADLSTFLACVCDHRNFCKKYPLQRTRLYLYHILHDILLISSTYKHTGLRINYAIDILSNINYLPERITKENTVDLAAPMTHVEDDVDAK